VQRVQSADRGSRAQEQGAGVVGGCKQRGGRGEGTRGRGDGETSDEARRFSKRLSEARIVKFACNVIAVGAGKRVQVTPKGATDPRQTTGEGAQLNGPRPTGYEPTGLGSWSQRVRVQGSVASHGGRGRGSGSRGRDLLGRRVSLLGRGEGFLEEEPCAASTVHCPGSMYHVHM
jgi:hypothetical protein